MPPRVIHTLRHSMKRSCCCQLPCRCSCLQHERSFAQTLCSSCHMHAKIYTTSNVCIRGAWSRVQKHACAHRLARLWHAPLQICSFQSHESSWEHLYCHRCSDYPCPMSPRRPPCQSTTESAGRASPVILGPPPGPPPPPPGPPPPLPPGRDDPPSHFFRRP